MFVECLTYFYIHDIYFFPTLFVYTILFFYHIYALVLCYFYIIFIFILLHCPLSGTDLIYISLLIIPCIIYYVTNKETLNLDIEKKVDLYFLSPILFIIVLSSFLCLLQF